MFGGAHDVPWDVKSANLETCVPPWTVRRQVWSDSLAANNSGISTDILLFSDIHLLLTHYYRVHKRGLPHIAFRKDYLTQLRVSVSGQSRRDPMRPVLEESVSDLQALTAQDPSILRTCRVPSCMTVGLRCGQYLCDWRILGRCL